MNKDPHAKFWAWVEWSIVFLSFALVLLLLTGCGTSREEVQHQESENKTITKTTTLAEVAKPNAVGALALVESTKTTTVSEQVAQGTVDANISAKTTLEVPEIKAAIGAVASIAAPGFGGLISNAIGLVTGTPEGATGGILLTTLLAYLTKRGVQGEGELKRTKKHFAAIVKGNSDYMQANPDQVEKFKQHQRSAQVDPSLKNSVLNARASQNLM